MMVRIAALWRWGLMRVRRTTRTDCRRPLMVAAAAGFMILHLLPPAASLQRVLVMNPGGWVEHEFSLSVDDPQLQSLRTVADAARQPNYRARTDDYYRAQWDMTAAEFYAAQTPAIDESVPIASGTPPAGTQPSGTVSQASFELVAPPAERRDWRAFWEQLRETSARRMQRLEPASGVDPIFARLRFGEIIPGPLPTASVFAALCMAAIAFVGARRWGCRPAQRMISLRSRHQLLVPPRWYRQRRSLDQWSGELTRGRLVECAAAVTIVGLLLQAWG